MQSSLPSRKVLWKSILNFFSSEKVQEKVFERETSAPTHEQWKCSENSMADGEAFFPPSSTKCFQCFPLHTQNCFDAVAALHRIVWMGISLGCEHQHDARRGEKATPFWHIALVRSVVGWGPNQLQRKPNLSRKCSRKWFVSESKVSGQRKLKD